jgi:uncharacterized protein (DUF608 family)
MSENIREDLFTLGHQKTYKGKYLNEISFPLGGIGTGSIGLTGNGSLKDFEIFNRPNYGSWYPKTYGIIRVKEEDRDPVCRILEGPKRPPYTPKDGGAYHCNGEGFPHMDSCEFRGEFPFAWVKFKSKEMPLKIELEAYNPFIPSEEDYSSYPAAILHYHITNLSDQDINVSILWSFLNLVGLKSGKNEQMIFSATETPRGKYLNKFQEDENIRGINFTSTEKDKDDPDYGSVVLATSNENYSYTPYWPRTNWFSAQNDIWTTFKESNSLHFRKRDVSNKAEAGALLISESISPGETKRFTFYIAWYFPNFEKYWDFFLMENRVKEKKVWSNYYASLFDDAFDVAAKLHKNEANLYALTKRFHDVLFSTTLPAYVIDAIASNIAILKTATCIRLTDGKFYGWEGTSINHGWCEGTCNHVWNYQQALAFLFPSLERSIHDLNLAYNFLSENSGAMRFRLQWPPKSKSYAYKYDDLMSRAADAQFGMIINFYRDWKISGNNEWLKNHWYSIKRSLEFAFEDWDKDKTGVLKGFQGNTYDIEFFGPNPLSMCYYLGALKAALLMADFLGDKSKAIEYREIFEKGRNWMDKHLFNGEYYIQLHDPKKAKKNQMGIGCLIDQLVGLQLSRIAGLDNFLEISYIRQTLKSIFKYNYKTNMYKHENNARLYAVNEEAGTVICTWPKGSKPKAPFTYAHEVMNGFEYQFAVHCIIEDLLEEGLKVVKSIRDRYDGYHRNPWDEFECGHHYARSMASYGLLNALSGFTFDKGEGYLGFSPKIHQDNFKCFWALDGVWGMYHQNNKKSKIEVLYGKISLKKLKLQILKDLNSVDIKMNDILIKVKVNDCEINFPNEIELNVGDFLEILF